MPFVNFNDSTRRCSTLDAGSSALSKVSRGPWREGRRGLVVRKLAQIDADDARDIKRKNLL